MDCDRRSYRPGVDPERSFFLKDICAPDDIVVIHDGIRPMVDSSVLTDVLKVARQYGNGVASLPYNEQIFVIDREDEGSTTEYIPRRNARRVQTPQAYRYGELYEAYQEAFEKQRDLWLRLCQHNDG